MIKKLNFLPFGIWSLIIYFPLFLIGCAKDNPPQSTLALGTSQTGGTSVFVDSILPETGYFYPPGSPVNCPRSIGPDPGRFLAPGTTSALSPPLAFNGTFNTYVSLGPPLPSTELLTADGTPLNRQIQIAMPVSLMPPTMVTALVPNRMPAVDFGSFANLRHEADINISAVDSSGMTNVSFNFKSLIPNAVYTVWLVYQNGPEPDLLPQYRFALTPFGGLPNDFVTDSNGNAYFQRKVAMSYFTVGSSIGPEFFNMDPVNHSNLRPTDRFSFIVGLHSTQQSNGDGSFEGLDAFMAAQLNMGMPNQFLGFTMDGRGVYDPNKCPFVQPTMTLNFKNGSLAFNNRPNAESYVMVPGLPGVTKHTILKNMTPLLPFTTIPSTTTTVSLTTVPLDEVYFNNNGVSAPIGDSTGKITSSALPTTQLINANGLPLNRDPSGVVFGPQMMPITPKSRVGLNQTLTLQEWQGAKADFSLSFDGLGNATVTISARGLPKEGLHTMWVMTTTSNGTPVALAPLGGMPNVLLPDNNGSATTSMTMSGFPFLANTPISGALDLSGGTHPTLLASDQLTVLIYYQSDQQSNGNPAMMSMVLSNMTGGNVMVPIITPGMRPYDFHPHLHKSEGFNLFPF